MTVTGVRFMAFKPHIGRTFMPTKEYLVLRLLMDNPRGLYGSAVVHLSNGGIGRGTVYSILDRLVAKGFVREIEEGPTTALQLKRTRHVITAQGQKALRKWVDSMGLDIREGAFTQGAA